MRALCDLLPCQERASFLGTRIRAGLLQSLEHLIEVNKSVLGVNYLKGRTLIEHLNLARTVKLPGLFYALNSFLLQATSSRQTQSIYSDISILFEIPLLEEIRYFNFTERESDNKRNELLRKYILFELPQEGDISEPATEESEKTKLLIKEALKLISECDEETYKEIIEFVSEFMILKTNVLKAGSSFDLYGLIFINVANADRGVINMVDLIIHEVSHLYLYNLGIEDPLVLNEYEEKYYSPIKERERPMLGVYHAAFVLTRVVRFLRILRKSNLLNFLSDILEIDTLIDQYYKIVSDSLEIVNSSAKLTNLGRDIMQSTEEGVKS